MMYRTFHHRKRWSPVALLWYPKLFARYSLRTILTTAPTHTPFIRHRRRSCSLPPQAAGRLGFALLLLKKNSKRTTHHRYVSVPALLWYPKLFARCSLRTILTTTPTHTPYIAHRARSCSLPSSQERCK